MFPMDIDWLICFWIFLFCRPRDGLIVGDSRRARHCRAVRPSYDTINDLSIEDEPLPDDMPPPLGASVKMLCFVDASHASNRVTMRSHTGIFIKLNNAPISWYSKRQNTVESSTFGSEFIALRIAAEMCQSLRYKLRMFGVPIEGPSLVFCDNQSVTNNVSVPTSLLSKKHNAICYHKVRECVASGWLRVGWIESKKNLADLFTKVLNAGPRNALIQGILDRWRGKASKED